jgi:hypothetical protein
MNEDKKTRKAPAFQFYADDFLAGTITMREELISLFSASNGLKRH